MTGPPAERTFSTLAIILLVLLWVVWGLSWPAMRVAFTELPIWQFRAVTSAIAGVVLLAAGVAVGSSWRVPRRLWRMLLLAAFFNITVWSITTGYGLSMIGSGHAAIICYTMPVWQALFSVALGRRLTTHMIVAVAAGAVGTMVLVSSDFAAIGARPLGIVFLVGSAIAWAIGTMAVKDTRWPVNMYVVAGWQLVIGGIPIAVVAAFTESFVLHEASERGWIAGLYTLLIAVIGGYALWFRLVQLLPPMVSSIGALMVPIIGVTTGALILGEPVGWREGVALAFVSSAIALVIFAPARRDIKQP